MAAIVQAAQIEYVPTPDEADRTPAHYTPNDPRPRRRGGAVPQPSPDSGRSVRRCPAGTADRWPRTGFRGARLGSGLSRCPSPKIGFGLTESPQRASFPEKGAIEIGDGGFVAAYDEIYDNREAYYGRSVVVSGYAAYQAGLGAGEFLVGRDLLWCCEDDMDFIGYLVRTDGPIPIEGSELRIEGIFKPISYYNEESKKTITVPGIVDARLTAVEGLARIVHP